MAVWNSSVDSGVKPAVADYRRHAGEVRVGFDVRCEGGDEGRVPVVILTLIIGFRIRIEIWARVRVWIRPDF